jgi:hypothetical protein
MKLTLLSPRSAQLDYERLSELACRRGMRLISNRLADRVLAEPALRQGYPGAWPICTSTCVAYPAAGAKLGQTIEYDVRPKRFVLDTKGFSGEKDVALVFESYHVERENGWSIIVPQGGMTAIERFPKESGWYGMDDGTGIPIAAETGERRYLWRSSGARIGFVARDWGTDGRFARDVFIHHRPGQPFGAIASEGGGNALVIPIPRPAARK